MITEQGGFGVPVADILFAPSTPACAFPGASMRRIFFSRLAPWLGNRNATVQIPRSFTFHKFLFYNGFIYFLKKLSEREGCEPSVPLRVHTTSNRTPSAARSSLQFPDLAFSFGERGIRTLGAREGSTVFETVRFNHSRISPQNTGN